MGPNHCEETVTEPNAGQLTGAIPEIILPGIQSLDDRIQRGKNIVPSFWSPRDFVSTIETQSDREKTVRRAGYGKEPRPRWRWATTSLR